MKLAHRLTMYGTSEPQFVGGPFIASHTAEGLTLGVLTPGM